MQKQQRDRKTVIKKIAVWAVAAALILLIGFFGYIYILILRMNQDAVKIIDKPSSSMLMPSQTLEPLKSTPADIGEDYNIDVSVPTQEPIFKQVAIDEDVINILFLGSDIRPGENGNGRSDSMILLSYNRNSQEAKLVSFMRDIWVHIPGHSYNRLNAAYAFGGVGLCINTINESFELDIQNYILVDFAGFRKIIDDLGGIRVYLTEKEAAHINERCSSRKLAQKNGIQLIDGAQTLVHCRNRKTGDGDFGRTRRQRDVMLAIFQRLRDENDLIKLSDLLLNNLEYVKTNMTPDMLVTIGMEVAKADKFSSSQNRVPFNKTWNYANKDGRSVISINLARNKDMLHKFLYGKE
ncbi:MAG: LCP family protein [Christensenellales bacterium]